MGRNRTTKFGPVLRNVMQVCGVSDLGGLAEALGVPEGTVRNWHKRNSVPSAWLLRIAKERGVSAEAFSAAPMGHEEPNNSVDLVLVQAHKSNAQGLQVTLLEAKESAPVWHVHQEAAYSELSTERSETPTHKVKAADLLRTRDAGAVRPLMLSLPLEAAGGPTGEYELIPMHVRTAAAGVGAAVKSGEPDLLNLAGQMAFSFEWLRRNLGHTSGQITSIDVRGDSMAPTLLDGDTIMIDEGVTVVDVDGIYVLDLYGRRLVKRVQHLFDGTLVLISDNSSYQRETIPRDQARDVVVIGRMVWPRVR